MSDYYELDPAWTDPARLRLERDRARDLKKSNWWNEKTQAGICHYCQKKFSRAELTLDHVVPLARGGSSTRGNCVPACKACNRDKKLATPVEQALNNTA